MKETIKKEILEHIEWLRLSREDMTGETRTNVLFQIDHLHKIADSIN